ncbi:hypothetical protein [Pseudonocardia sp. GCM10023141]|uniref:hypothetical protein n=1 Tax=Pseudonocardia sp. GCM10023141 TaxID=3252653 RepID=UPI003618C521
MPTAGSPQRYFLGYNVHTTTDSGGRYSMTLPADVYVALALDTTPGSSNNYRVASGDNSVSVPPSVRVDFVAE